MSSQQRTFVTPSASFDNLIDVIVTSDGAQIPLQFRQDQQFPALKREENEISYALNYTDVNLMTNIAPNM